MSRHIWHTQASAIMASAAISHTGWHPAMVQFVARAGMQLQTGMWLHIWHSQAVADIQLLPRGGMWRHIGICPHTSDRLACMCCPICAQSWHVEADWHVPAYLAYALRLPAVGMQLSSSLCPELTCRGRLACPGISGILRHQP